MAALLVPQAESITAASTSVNELVERIKTWRPTRELSLAKTKLQEAEFWLRQAEYEHEKERGQG